MTQPDNSAHRSPRRRSTARTDSTHPAPARPGGRRGGDRRPWPTAPTTTRVSPGKPAKSTAGTGRSRGSTPTPATVWTAGSAPIDLAATWPAALVERIVTSFSKPAERVVLLDWPTLDRTRPTLGVVGADRVIDHAPGTEPDPELADAIAVVERLHRAARVERIPVDPTSTCPAFRPFWADLVGGAGPAPVTLPTAPEVIVEVPFPDTVTEPVDSADLIVTRLPPHRSSDHDHGTTADLIADLVTLYAARRLRAGGILVVLTHCDWTSGELTDLTGAVVTAGQNADLLYLQHIVALHTPVRDGRFRLADAHSDTHSEGVHGDRDTDDGDARARHRASVRGLPAPHRRIHSDVLVFVQPHDHRPTLPASPSALTETVPQPGDLR